MQEEKSKVPLFDVIKAHAKTRRRHAVMFIRLSAFLIVFSTIASAAATIIATVQAAPPALRASIAAIPGVLLVILSRFRLEDRYRWHFKKCHQLEGLRCRIEYEGLDDKTASEMYRKINLGMHDSYPNFKLEGREPGRDPKLQGNS